MLKKIPAYNLVDTHKYLILLTKPGTFSEFNIIQMREYFIFNNFSNTLLISTNYYLFLYVNLRQLNLAIV